MGFFIFMGGAVAGGMIGVVMMCLLQINRCEECPVRIGSGEVER